jgi:photosystem II stability/assembly factor-like uncharacterized protein
MKLLYKTKMVLKAGVVIAIALAFVMPVTASISKSPMIKQTPQQPKNFFSSAEWIEQASGFWDLSQGIHYMCAVDENITWAVGYDGSGSSTPVQEFTRTINGGDLWVADLIDGAPTDGDTAMIFALDDMTAWVPIHTGTPQGIWKTSDGGDTWAQQTTADFTGGFPNCVHFWDENIGWCMGDPVGGYFQIYTTTDGGNNWIRVPQGNIPAPSSSVEYGVVGYYDVVGDTVWFGTQDATLGGRVFKSIDKGYHWTVSNVIFSAGSYVDIRFKDALHGLAMDKNFEEAALAETADGGATWTLISQTGMCYAADFDYVPGTTNMYVSTGVNKNDPAWQGASYSLDGGHTWTTWNEMSGTQLFGTTWVDGKIGWAGTFNTDGTTGGVWKHLPSGNPQPALTISIAGGKGFTVTVKNIGEADATNVTCDVTIEGGLFIKPKDFSKTQATLDIGGNFTLVGAPKGIGLGLLKPMPTIKINVNCTEGISATKTVQAKIFFSKITLQ